MIYSTTIGDTQVFINLNLIESVERDTTTGILRVTLSSGASFLFNDIAEITFLENLWINTIVPASGGMVSMT